MKCSLFVRSCEGLLDGSLETFGIVQDATSFSTQNYFALGWVWSARQLTSIPPGYGCTRHRYLLGLLDWPPHTSAWSALSFLRFDILIWYFVCEQLFIWCSYYSIQAIPPTLLPNNFHPVPNKIPFKCQIPIISQQP